MALEDASLNTWMHPVDGTEYIYYPKGSLAGLLLDIMIRDASDNAQSLDDVMRGLYQSDVQARTRLHGGGLVGRGQRGAPDGKSFAAFNAQVHRRPRAVSVGQHSAARRPSRARSECVPRLGVLTQQDANGVRGRERAGRERRGGGRRASRATT